MLSVTYGYLIQVFDSLKKDKFRNITGFVPILNPTVSWFKNNPKILLVFAALHLPVYVFHHNPFY